MASKKPLHTKSVILGVDQSGGTSMPYKPKKVFDTPSPVLSKTKGRDDKRTAAIQAALNKIKAKRNKYVYGSGNLRNVIENTTKPRFEET